MRLGRDSQTGAAFEDVLVHQGAVDDAGHVAAILAMEEGGLAFDEAALALRTSVRVLGRDALCRAEADELPHGGCRPRGKRSRTRFGHGAELYLRASGTDARRARLSRG